MKKSVFSILILLISLHLSEGLFGQVNFPGPELVGCPTDNSIRINIVPDANIELYYQYGTSSGTYTSQTATTSATGGQPHEVLITGLAANTRYYYRMQYRVSGGSWQIKDEHSFMTQRNPGSSFIFTVTSDSHAQLNTAFRQAMTNIRDEQSDFNFDLGDTFYPGAANSQTEVDNTYMAYRAANNMGIIGYSVPTFLAAGNHEDEEGWNLDDTPFSSAQGSIQARKKFYPTPTPDGFYTGNSDPLPAIDESIYGDQLREDYYAFEWGDALFVVIDEYQYTMTLPYTPAAGEENDETVVADQWNWTLGKTQYDWLKSTLENSNAKYKFVFSHHVTGGIPNLTISGAGPGYVRGGAGAAPYFEWGGKNADGTDGFMSHRPGWGVDDDHPNGTPIHQLLVENGVSAYFHGHDHQYVYESLDGVVYQEVPSPGMTMGFSGIYSESNSYTHKILPSTGHLRLSVTPALTTVDYITSTNTSAAVQYSYDILPNVPVVTHDLTLDVIPAASGSTSPAAGTHSYAENSVVTVSATANLGFAFSHWEGDVIDLNASTTTVVMDVDQTVTAYFNAAPTYELSMVIDPPGSGTTDPVSGVHTYTDGTEVTITATPAAGYVFDHWGSDVADPENAITTVVLDENQSVTAYFIEAAPGGPVTYIGDIPGVTANAAGTSLQLTVGSAGVAAGNTIIVGFASRGAATYNQPTVADDAGNTYQLATFAVTYQHGRSYIYYAYVENALSNGHHITITTSSLASRVAVASVFSGILDVGALDQALGNPPIDPQTTTQGNNPTVGPTGTTAQANELIIGVIGTEESSDAGIGTWLNSFTTGPQIKTSGATNEWRVSMGYQIVSSTGAFTAAKTLTNNPYWAASIATFRSGSTEPPVQYTIDASAGANGSISPSGDVLVNQGANQSFSITPAIGYRVADVLVDGSSVGTVTSYQFTDVQGDHSIAASFEEIPAGAITYLGQIGSIANNAAGTSLQLLLTTGVAVGNTIIVGFASRGAQTYNEPTVSDAAGNTYHLASFGVTYSHGRSYIYYASVEHALSSGQNITITTSSVESRIAVASAFSGLITINPIDQAMGFPVLADQETAQGNNPSVGPTSITSQANELIIGMIATEEETDAGTGTWLNSFTTGPQLKTSGANYEWRISMGYQIASSTGAFTAAKTVTNEPYWAAAIATFKTENILPEDEYNIVLSRPTANSVAASTILEQDGDVYIEYGTSSGAYTSGQSAILPVTTGNPVEIFLNGLNPNTKYYYRLVFMAEGSSLWTPGGEYSFHTQRADDETFTFTIISDSHLGETFSGNTPGRYNQTTLNVAADHPDFHLDLGDAFLMNTPTNQTQANAIYAAQRPYFGNFSHSTPVFLAIGNHENEEGWNFDDTFSKALASIKARKQYFPNPIPDEFYSGNEDLLPAIGGDQYREDYYSWEWGDALFIVLDPFQYTMIKPYGTVTGSGEDNDETVSGDQWNWTLGQQQYNWFRETLEGSNARYKFVFSHHVVGGQITVSNSAAGPPTYVRGGAMAANYFEWGGQNANDSWGFTGHRNEADFDTISIHQLMIDNNVSAFFHGHDHQFVHEEIDGIVYQLVPSPGMEGYGFNLYEDSPYVISGGNLPDPGHLRVTVAPDETLVEYISSEEGGGGINGQIAYSYTIDPGVIVTNYELTMAMDPSGSGIISPAAGIYTYNENEVVTITAEAAEGYMFSHWTGDVDDANSASTTVTMDADKSVTANFIAIYELTLAVEPVSSGTTSPETGVHSYNENEVVSILAEAEAGFMFSYWEGDVTDVNSASTTVTIDENKSVTAHFVELVPFIEVISPNGGEQLQIGTLFDITWTSFGTSGNVYIEYSINNGTAWSDVTASTPNDGLYSWTIPNNPSFECLIRISDTDANPTDQSDAIFRILPDPPMHFVPVWINNGLDHMNFYAKTAKIEDVDMQPGDEIGIFDGDYCIGSGRITEVLNGITSILDIRVSKDDPETGEIDGYIPEHIASFKLWDSVQQKEIPIVEVIFDSGSDTLRVSNSSWFHINGVNQVTQDISLQNGWNIFSLNVAPENINMLNIVQPLIDLNRLVKVQNESGASIEQIPNTTTWINQIGNWNIEEGYKIRVNASATTLQVTGYPITDPVDINLPSGWSIISFPSSGDQYSEDVLADLMGSTHLVKVQDEAGASIEQIPGTSTWMNQIGDFKSGEGYKVRVTALETLTIDPSLAGTSSLLKSTATRNVSEYFAPVWKGNGYDHMNIYLTGIEEGLSGLEAGDEIGIFDGPLCVGSGVIQETNARFHSFVASADDPTTRETDGFTEGNQLSFKLWRPSTNQEISLNNVVYSTGGSNVYEPMGTAVVGVNLTTLGLKSGVEQITSLGDNYPNPLSGTTTIPFVIGTETAVDISIYNILGKKVNTLVHENLQPGNYTAVWNATDTQNNRIMSGIYFCKMIAGEQVFVKMIEVIIK